MVIRYAADGGKKYKTVTSLDYNKSRVRDPGQLKRSQANWLERAPKAVVCVFRVSLLYSYLGLLPDNSISIKRRELSSLFDNKAPPKNLKIRQLCKPVELRDNSCASPGVRESQAGSCL